MLVEFYGDNRAEVEAMEGHLRRQRLGYAYSKALEPEEQLNIWKVRKGSQGLLMSVLGDQKPIAFVEDSAVPVENLPEFLRRFQQLLTDYDTVGGYYGHAPDLPSNRIIREKEGENSVGTHLSVH